MRLRKPNFVIVFVRLILIFAALGGVSAFGQEPALKVVAKPFEQGEELIYKAEISRSLLRKLDVATFKFSAGKTSALPEANSANGGATDSATALRFTSDVASEGFFVKLFNIHFHQHVESIVDPESLAVQRTVKLDEQGKRVRSSEAIFDRKAGKVTWTERDPKDPTRPVRTVSSDFAGPVQDVLSAIYYVRTQQLDIGKSFDVSISDSGRVVRIPVRVVEKTRMKTALGRVTVVRIDPELFGQRALVNLKGQFSIWLTDDKRHIPVKAVLKSEYGTFEITLKKFSH
jgi:hypothetical protein